MHLVRLLRGWNGGFNRSVKDDKGEVIDMLRFEPGETLELDDVEFAAVQNDLGKALEEVESIDGKIRPKGFVSDNPNEPDAIKKSPRRTAAEQPHAVKAAAKSAETAVKTTSVPHEVHHGRETRPDKPDHEHKQASGK